jgi:uncharacterized protein (DUF885 family)
MQALKQALEDLKSAEARYHDLLDPAGHMAKATQALAVATAETVLASINGLSERLSKLEAFFAQAPKLPGSVTFVPATEEPSTAAPDPAPAAAVPQDAKPAAEAPETKAG